jgi:hypothetical protein
MTSNFKKVLYLGAGEHIEVVNYFPNCNEFVLIDTKPRSEHDEKEYFYEEFYREHFLKTVIKKCEKHGFILNEIIELDSNYINTIKIIELKPHNINMNRNIINIPYINPHLLIFMNDSKKQTIKYYISTNILFNMYSVLEEDIKSCDTLYVAGYHPDIILLNYINKNINFVGDNNTVYIFEYDTDENTIISNNIKFDNYYLVWRRKSMIILCDSLEDIENKRKQLC